MIDSWVSESIVLCRVGNSWIAYIALADTDVELSGENITMDVGCTLETVVDVPDAAMQKSC